MPRKSTKSLATKPASFATLDTLLPDEDPREFAALTDSITSELQPRTAYQSCLVMNIVQVEWDIRRHRRLLAATIKTAFAQQASGVYDNGEPAAIKSFYSTKPERQEFLDQIKSADEEDRKAADVVLRARNVTRAQITAAAFASREAAVSYHEARLSELERRRRSLFECYEAIRSRNAIEPILDVDVVEAA